MPDSTKGRAKKLITAKELTRLREAMKWSRKKLKPFRESNVSLIKQYAGKHYSDNGSADIVPVNYIELAVGIYRYQLAAAAPKALVTTPYPKLKAQAKLLELATNQQIDEMQLEETLQEVVTSALFSIGIVKHGLATVETVEFDGENVDITEPFVAAVDIDDWVHDMRATHIRKASFMADRYPVPIETIKQWKNAKEYTEKYGDVLEEDNQPNKNEDGTSRASSITQGEDGEPESYIKEAEVWDIWLPAKNAIITIPADLNLDGPPLKEREHKGPKTGPYLGLSFGDVPGNSMPLAPAQTWRDLADLANRVFRKIGRQVERQKTITVVKRGSEKDGAKVRDGNDGDMVAVDGNVRDNVAELNYGGLRGESLAFFGELKNISSYFMGNLDTQGGLSPMTDTVGQDELLAQNASKRVEYMKNRTIKFAGDVIRAIAQYEWEDPLMERTLELSVPGTDLSIPREFSADDRLGEYLDFNFNIEPYSMQRQTPATKLRMINDIVQNYIMPLMPVLEQQGIQVDIEAILRALATYSNLHEVGDFIHFSTPLVPGPIGEPPGSHMPANTTRTNVRVNRSGATEQGRNNALTQMFAGGGLNEGQAAALNRPTG